MLLIVCPNLCLDRVVVVPDFASGRIHRAESHDVLASGKGLNVARAARVLGAEVTVVGVTGTDDAARAIARGARAHGIHLRTVRAEGPSRVCVLVVNPGQEETVINEEGPTVDADGRRLLMDAVRAGLRHAHIMVLAGSLPPGLPDDFYAQAIGLARARRIRVLLDASGAPLRQGLAARPDFVKVNRAELAGATGRSLTSLDDVVAGAEDLVEALGCQVVVTMGPDGAALVTREGRWHLAPPPVQRMSTIGAGDSLTAGLVVGLMRGLPLREAAMIGIAAAAADVTSLLPGTIDAAQVETLRSGVTVHTLEGEAT